MIKKFGASDRHKHYWPGDSHLVCGDSPTVMMHQPIGLLIISVTYTYLQGACLLLQQLIDRCKVTKESVPQLTAKVSNLISTPMTFDEVC